MAQDPFIHLHLHTENSLLDGAVRIPDLMEKAKRLGMPAVAMTDHGNVFGAIDFYMAGTKAGIKPIIGCEAYLTPPGVRMTDRKAEMPGGRGGPGRARDSHLTLLAADNRGWSNLMKLVSMAHLEGMYYKPRIDKEALAAHSEGLIALSGCINGEINQRIQADDLAGARRGLGEFIDIFGRDNFYLEMHDHGMEAQAKCNRQLVEFSKELGLGLVAANDVHFLNRSDHEAHDVMICIGTAAKLLDLKRMRYSPEVYFKSAAEMAALFRETPDALRNTLVIADRCNVEIKLDPASSEKYPQFEAPDGSGRDDYFRKLCFEGLRWRYEERADTDAELRRRLNYEIKVMTDMGFVSYFLITWDFVKWAKDHGVPVGPGRGSAAGSLVAYVLGITDICPLRFGLIFERFLNPERVSPPDIDIDFCQARRSEVIDYVRRKYGERAVSHIVTFGTLGAKSVVRDVARAMDLSFTDGDRIAKMIPNELKITLAGAYKKNPELKAELEQNPTAAELWKHATFLEGLQRGTGVHAAGVVIGDRDLTDYVPLTRAKEGEITTQFAMNPLTELGMLKMDFLGLKTLTVIQDAMELIHAREPGFVLDSTELDDKAAYELLNRGETVGVFQLESGGMMNLCRQFEVDRIEDIIALIALYRPGPMDLIPDFIARKKGKTKVKYLHPLLEEASKDTFGILIYQEQVQRAANLLAGYSLGEADLLRRAMGKKKAEAMAKQRKKFVAGCKEVNNIPAKQADEIFDLLEKFAGYGFNKSHSAAYGLISYQTAFLKANYPVEFMAALLSNEINNTEKISVFVSECQRMGIRILAPDINRSQLKFSPESAAAVEGRAIRFGLAAIKNVGEGAMRAAIAERDAAGPFASLEDFAARLDAKVVNRKILENLVKAGAFDYTGERRDSLYSRVGQVIAGASSAHRDRASGQVSLFDMNELMAAAPPPEAVEEDRVEWDEEEYLSHEKDLLGFYVTGHPLDRYRDTIAARKFRQVSGIQDLKADTKAEYRFAGLIQEMEVKYTKRESKPFAVISFLDFSGSTELMAWNEVYEKRKAHLAKGAVLVLTARVESDQRSEMKRLVAADIVPLQLDPSAPPAERPALAPPQPDPAPAPAVASHHAPPAPPVVVSLDCIRDSGAALDLIRQAALRHPGRRPLHLCLRQPDGCEVILAAGPAFQVSDDFALASEISLWLND